MSTKATSNVFSDHLCQVGLFRGREIPPQVRRLLRELETRDMILTPAGGVNGLQFFGIDKPQMFKDLNIAAIRVISYSARENPEALALLLGGMADVKTLKQLYGQMVEGAKSGLIALREPEVTPMPSSFDSNLYRIVKKSGLDFEIISYEKHPNKEEVEEEYRLQTRDAITGQVLELAVNIRDTQKGANRFVAIQAGLPWNSPNLVAKLNQLFGMSWYHKFRLRYMAGLQNMVFIEPRTGSRALPASQHRHIAYVWGFYQYPDIAELKKEYIFAIDQRDNLVLTGVNLTLEEFGDIQAKRTMGLALEEQLMVSIGSLADRPDLQSVLPDLYWDLGIARDMARS